MTPEQLEKAAADIKNAAKSLEQALQAAAAYTKLPIIQPYAKEVRDRYGDWLPKRLSVMADQLRHPATPEDTAGRDPLAKKGA